MTMKTPSNSTSARLAGMAVLSLLVLSVWSATRRTQAEGDSPVRIAPATVDEARGRARLLHETIRGSLQVMHRDYFNDESPAAIPSSSLEDVFDELARSFHVEARWLTVETDILNVDHKPVGKFEQQAVKALAAGETEFESIDGRAYRYAGAIRLSSQCLKCHVKNRTSTESRTAGLVLSMPVKRP